MVVTARFRSLRGVELGPEQTEWERRLLNGRSTDMVVFPLDYELDGLLGLTERIIQKLVLRLTLLA